MALVSIFQYVKSSEGDMASFGSLHSDMTVAGTRATLVEISLKGGATGMPERLLE